MSMTNNITWSTISSSNFKFSKLLSKKKIVTLLNNALDNYQTLEYEKFINYRVTSDSSFNNGETLGEMISNKKLKIKANLSVIHELLRSDKLASTSFTPEQNKVTREKEQATRDKENETRKSYDASKLNTLLNGYTVFEKTSESMQAAVNSLIEMMKEKYNSNIVIFQIILVQLIQII